MADVALETRTDQKRGETVDFAVRHLLDGILQGRFAPGQRLISRDLTEEMGISRSSVREAFRLLAADGLVELIPNRGAMVRRLSCAQALELFQIRGALEGLAARLAAINIDIADNRRRFTDVWEQVRPRGEQLPWNVFIERNRLFHRAIVEVSGNLQLSELVDKLQLPILMMQMGRVMGATNISRSEVAHVAIAEAILAADPDAADRAMRDHLQGVADLVHELPGFAFKQDKAAAGQRSVERRAELSR